MIALVCYPVGLGLIAAGFLWRNPDEKLGLLLILLGGALTCVAIGAA